MLPVLAVLLAALCLLVTAPAALARADQPIELAEPGSGVVVLSGRGHGHGVGRSQDGALAPGRQGRSLAQVLGTFYPGTSLTHGGASGTVRVAVAAGRAHDRLRVTLPAGGSVRSGSFGVVVAARRLCGPRAPGPRLPGGAGRSRAR